MTLGKAGGQAFVPEFACFLRQATLCIRHGKQPGAESRAGLSGQFSGGDARGGSARLVEQLAADQHAADFAGAGADLVQLRVAQQAAGVVIVDVAVATQRLNRFQRHLRCFLRGLQNAARRVEARDFAAIAGGGGGGTLNSLVSL